MKKALVLILMIPFIVGFNKEAAEMNDTANALYEKGQFKEAKVLYLEARDLEPDSEKLVFNTGNANHQLEDYEKALKDYGKLAKKKAADEKIRSESFYNMGNTYFVMQKLDPAIEQYKNSLRINPEDYDAKHNLELALQRKDEQQNQEKQEQQNQQHS